MPVGKQVPELQVTLPVVPEFWAVGPSKVEDAGHELAMPQRARGKVLAIQLGPKLPALTIKELACQL